jgi:hypothetical protein
VTVLGTMPFLTNVARIAVLVHVGALGAFGCSGAPKAAKTEAPREDSGASWVDAALARVRVDTGDAGGMRGCTGTLTPAAKTFFAALYKEASKCAAAAGAPVKGTVTFHSTLEEGGGLSEFSVLDDKLAAPGVVKCIQEKAMSVEFPKVDAKVPCVQLVHPLAFP